MTNPLIEIRDLSVSFPSEVGTVQAVRNISLDIRAGEVLGIVGESGSGKTVTSLATIGLLPESATVSGSVMFNGVNLLELNDDQMSKYRGNQIAMIFQLRLHTNVQLSYSRLSAYRDQPSALSHIRTSFPAVCVSG